MPIKNNYLVEKRNVLNELRSNEMTLQELRFFSIYLSKINSRDLSTRIVRFSLDDFRKIMEFGGRINTDYLQATTNNLLSKVVNIPLDKRGNYTAFQLFKKCTINMDEYGDKYIEIDAHDDSLPLMFEFKEKYFSYQLWNALKLKSSNQLRMYEILKQYEKVGERIITIADLKELLGIEKDHYSRWDNFKTHVLEVCKEALEKNTDIRYTYEPTGKKGRSGRILSLRFTIFKNENYTDPLSLDDFISNQSETYDDEIIDCNFEDKQLYFIAGACNYEFSENEMRVLLDLIKIKIPYVMNKDMAFDYYHYLERKINELDLQASKRTINNRFGYLKTIIKADVEK